MEHLLLSSLLLTILLLRSHCDEFTECSTLCLASFIGSRDHGESVGEGTMVDPGSIPISPPSLDYKFQDSPGDNNLCDTPFYSSIDDGAHGLQDKEMYEQ